MLAVSEVIGRVTEIVTQQLAATPPDAQEQ
jgi:hypothetical protein